MVNWRVRTKRYMRMGKKLKQLEEDLAKSVEILEGIDKKMDYLENQSWRSNIIIDGVLEECENWEMSEMKVQEILGKKLGLNVKYIEIERAHRVGKFDDSRPRQIVVKLLRYKDKQMIQSHAKKLKGTRIYINEDYPDLIKKKRKEFMPELRAAWERDDSPVLRNPPTTRDQDKAGKRGKRTVLSQDGRFKQQQSLQNSLPFPAISPSLQLQKCATQEHLCPVQFVQAKNKIEVIRKQRPQLQI
ncbi:uncharacterized protein LOC135258512 [Anguilla rostrata]|uniref:uncharacterized protein LOC135258512 n=1 Tax=Anguilla rostrata TaxID=7938 RepID=UPI0030CCEC6B